MFELLLVIAPTLSCAEMDQVLFNLSRTEGLTAVQKREVAIELLKRSPMECDLNICDFI